VRASLPDFASTLLNLEPIQQWGRAFYAPPGGRLIMYETRFGLRRRPFRATPDTAFYYPATGHERALAQLQQAIADDEGLLLLTAGPGLGKTLLGHCLIERLGTEVTSAFLTNSHLRDCMSLLQAICYDLSLSYEGKSEQELRLSLTDFLLKNCSAGRRTVLLIDEAQYLGVELLEELRLLGNLEAGDTKAFQVLVTAQPGLEQTLRSPGLESFNQRLAVRAQLTPLAMEEAADYLVHHLRGAGGRPEQIITDEALEMLARGSKGVPRLLNQAAHQALSLAVGAEAEMVDAEVALEALAVCSLGEDLSDSLTNGELEEDTEEAQGDGAVLESIEKDDPLNHFFKPPRRGA
jgi:MSHA biogenesis protein MshM